VRSVDLALYADVLAGEAASLAARIERERGKQRQASIEREARAALAPFAAERLEELEESLDAIELLQAWVEGALARAVA